MYVTTKNPGMSQMLIDGKWTKISYYIAVKTCKSKAHNIMLKK